MSNNYNFRSAFKGFNREDVVHYIEYMNSNHYNQINQLRAELASLHQNMAAENGANTPIIDPQLVDRCQVLESRCAQLEEQLATVTAERDDARKAMLSQPVSPIHHETPPAISQPELPVAPPQPAAAPQPATIPQPVAAPQPVAIPQPAAIPTVISQPIAAPLIIREVSTPCGFADNELAAYRRAERVEREARERTAALEQETLEKTRRLEEETQARVDAIYAHIRQVLSEALVKSDEAVSQLGNISDQLNTQLDTLQSAVDGSHQSLQDAMSALEKSE